MMKMKDLRENLPKTKEETVLSFWRENGSPDYGSALNLYSADKLVEYANNCFDSNQGKSGTWNATKSNEAKLVEERVHDWLSKAEHYWEEKRNYLGLDENAAWAFFRSYCQYHALLLFFDKYDGGLDNLLKIQ